MPSLTIQWQSQLTVCSRGGQNSLRVGLSLQRDFIQSMVVPGLGMSKRPIWPMACPATCRHAAGLGPLCGWTTVLGSPGGGSVFWVLLPPAPWKLAGTWAHSPSLPCTLHQLGPMHIALTLGCPMPIPDLPAHERWQQPGKSCCWAQGKVQPLPPHCCQVLLVAAA